VRGPVLEVAAVVVVGVGEPLAPADVAVVGCPDGASRGVVGGLLRF